MSIYGQSQVEDLIIGAAVASETTTATFISSASDKEIKVLSTDGTAPALGADFKVLQKTAGDASKGLDFEFSDVIGASKVEKVILKETSPEVQKAVTVSGFNGNIVANTTYAVEVRIYNDGGTLSVENFAVVTGYYATGASVAGLTAQNIQDGVIASLNFNLKRRGGNEVVVATVNADSFTITGKVQVAVPGKIVGRQIEFDVTAKQFDDTAVIHENLGLLSTAVTAENKSGNGTGKYAVNTEWFIKGYKYEVYRQTGYPADFGERTPYYADANSTYNVIHIKYFSDRQSPTVEKQKKVLTILVLKTNTASNAATNAVLADLRTILGTANVPANLAIV